MTLEEAFDEALRICDAASKERNEARYRFSFAPESTPTEEPNAILWLLEEKAKER